MVAGVESRLLPPWLDTEIAVAPDVDGPPRVVRPGDALDHERAAPLLAQPGQVLPGRRGRPHPLAVGAEEGRDLRVAGAQVGHAEVGQGAAADPARQVLGLDAPPGARTAASP